MAKFPSHLLGKPGIHDGVTVESSVFHRETSLPSTLTPYRLARTWFTVASTAASFTLPLVCSFTSVAAAAHSGSRLQKTPCTLKGYANSRHTYFNCCAHFHPVQWNHTWETLRVQLYESCDAPPSHIHFPILHLSCPSPPWMPAPCSSLKTWQRKHSAQMLRVNIHIEPELWGRTSWGSPMTWFSSSEVSQVKRLKALWLKKVSGTKHLLFAVSTPGSIKLNHPNIFTVKDILVKVVVCQLNHVLLTWTVTSALSFVTLNLRLQLGQKEHYHHSKYTYSNNQFYILTKFWILLLSENYFTQIGNIP